MRGALRKLTLSAVLTAVLYVQQAALSFLPNIHLCALLIMLYTLCFPRQVPLILAAFVLLEGISYGFGIWWISYLYAWPLLSVLTWLCRKNESMFVWAAIGGAFGLCFGLLCSLPYLVMGGLPSAIAYWSAGIPFDCIHCLGNIAGILILWKPLYKVLSRYAQRLNDE